MKKTKQRLFTFLGILFFAKNALLGLDVGVSHIVYATPTKSYVEISMEVAAAAVNYVHVDSTNLQAGVHVLILVKDGERIVSYEKYELNSPVVTVPQSILDVKRMMLANGSYQLEMTFTDSNDSLNTASYRSDLEVNVSDQLYLSDIQLLRQFKEDQSDNPFTKNGYYLEPLPFKYYDRAAKTMAFYAEIYYSSKATSADFYTIRYIVEEEKGNGNKTLVSAGVQRKKPNVIDAVLVPIDIKELSSGNYLLTVEFRDHTNALLQKREVQFQRSNPFQQIQEEALTAELMAEQFVEQLEEEELRYALRAISPLTQGDDTETLKNILARESDLKAMRFFLFRHFVKKDPNNPEQAYKEYLTVARQVDEKFHSGFRHGFETDRGRIFMRYGSPDDYIHVEDEPSAPPYEIWVYYNFPVTRQKNVKFLFYNPSLAGEDYIILHSTARGEINNPRWERDLYSRNAGEEFDGANYHDATQMKSNTNRNARIYFEDF
ncbi:MAG: GWxTD domain-containing protein [Saprospiraceae bacterium]